MFVYFWHSIMVVDGLNQSISYAANFMSVILLSPSRIRRFLIFDIDSLSKTSRFVMVDELDDAFDGTENDDVDIDEDDFVDDREETVDGGEREEPDTTTDEFATLAIVCIFFFAANDLPCFVFVGGLLMWFAMLASDSGFMICGVTSQRTPYVELIK